MDHPNCSYCILFVISRSELNIVPSDLSIRCNFFLFIIAVEHSSGLISLPVITPEEAGIV